MEDALYEIESMRCFAGLCLTGLIPDETTILNFRHPLEKNKLGQILFATINKELMQNDLTLKEGTIVDTTIISAPSSTKNKDGKRDEEMASTRKGNQSYFGMKMHIGTDDAVGCIHSIDTTPASAHDITAADHLLHGEEERVWGDAGYVGIEKRDEHKARKARKVQWFIACRPGKLRGLPKRCDTRATEKIKAQIRAKVEHPFLYIKRMFAYTKVRYKGLAKNHDRLCLLAGFYNLIRMDRLVS